MGQIDGKLLRFNASKVKRASTAALSILLLLVDASI